MDSEVIRLESCPKCQASMGEDARFCSACGKAAARPKAESETESFRQTVTDFAKGTALEARNLSTEVLKSDVGKKVAAGAVLGAIAGAALPLLTAGIGATLGAGYVAFKRLTK